MKEISGFFGIGTVPLEYGDAAMKRRCAEELGRFESELGYAAVWEDVGIPGSTEYRIAYLRFVHQRGVLEKRVPDYRRILRRKGGADAASVLSAIRSDRQRLASLTRELEIVFLRAPGEAKVLGMRAPSREEVGGIRHFLRRTCECFRGIFFKPKSWES